MKDYLLEHIAQIVEGEIRLLYLKFKESFCGTAIKLTVGYEELRKLLVQN